MIDRFNAALRFQSEALALRSERQALLASNIANADTPGYKARDADFASALKRRVGESEGPAARPAPGAPALPGARAAFAPQELKVTSPAQAAQDQNTVDMDAERARFADNAVKYEAALRMLNHQVKSLLTAITG